MLYLVVTIVLFDIFKKVIVRNKIEELCENKFTFIYKIACSSSKTIFFKSFELEKQIESLSINHFKERIFITSEQ
jgi:hypothetical protein